MIWRRWRQKVEEVLDRAGHRTGGRVPWTSRSPRCGTTVIVVDASVLATVLADDGQDGERARARLRREVLAAPEPIGLEVTSVLRRLVLADQLLARRAEQALSDLVELPLRHAPHGSMLPRCWELRANLTVYDACYVAQAEALGVPLLTADPRLSSAPGLRCTVELLSGT